MSHFDKRELLGRNRRNAEPSKCSSLLKNGLILLFGLIFCGIVALGLTEVIVYVIERVPGTEVEKVPVCEKRVIGYYSLQKDHEVSDKHLSKLTHLVFSSASLSFDGTIKFSSEPMEERFMKLKQRAKENKNEIKVMVSITGGAYSTVLADSHRRLAFVNSISSFLETHRIDGVDLDWRYPSATDRRNLSKFLKQLKEKLHEKGSLISIVLPPSDVGGWERGYDMDDLVEYCDFINVYSTAYYGPWQNNWGAAAGPSSPLFSEISERKHFNVDWTMKHYSCATGKPEKFNLVIYLPVALWKNVKEAYSDGREVFRKVELKDGKADTKNYVSRGEAEHDGWNLRNANWDEESKSSFIYNATTKQYISVETERSVMAKAEYVKKMGLGGVWISNLNLMEASDSVLNALGSSEYCEKAGNIFKSKYNC